MVTCLRQSLVAQTFSKSGPAGTGELALVFAAGFVSSGDGGAVIARLGEAGGAEADLLPAQPKAGPLQKRVRRRIGGTRTPALWGGVAAFGKGDSVCWRLGTVQVAFFTSEGFGPSVAKREPLTAGPHTPLWESIQYRFSAIAIVPPNHANCFNWSYGAAMSREKRAKQKVTACKPVAGDRYAMDCILTATILLLLALGGSSCSNKKPGLASKSEEAAPMQEKQPLFDAGRAVHAVPTEDRSAVEASKVDTVALRKVAQDVVDQWLLSQNNDEYEMYSQLYAEAFHGVRRSGPKKIEMNRKEWLFDRKRMFGKPMKVVVSDMDIRLVGDQANVRLIQTWSTSTYEDVGPKRLTINLKNKRIIAEEMIASTVIKSVRKAAHALGLSSRDASRLSCHDVPASLSHVVCVVDMSNRKLLAKYRVALLRKEGKRWILLEEHSASVEAKNMAYGPTNTASVDSWLEEIGHDKVAIAITAESESEGGWGDEVDDPGGHDRTAETKWFAIEGDGLREILSVESGGWSNLVYSGDFENSTLTVKKRIVNGYYTVEEALETTRWGDEVEHGIGDPEVRVTTKTLAWDLVSKTYK